MKNFLLADSSEPMALRLISVCWAWWLLDSFRPAWFLLSRHDVRRVHEKFSSRRFELANACLTHFGLLSPKTFDSYFLDMMYVEFMKNFPLPIRTCYWFFWLISASSAQKRLIPTFWTWCTWSSWNIFLSPIRTSWWLSDSFRPPEPKNVWFLLSRHDVRRVHEQFFSRRFERADGC